MSNETRISVEKARQAHAYATEQGRADVVLETALLGTLIEVIDGECDRSEAA